MTLLDFVSLLELPPSIFTSSLLRLAHRGCLLTDAIVCIRQTQSETDPRGEVGC